uniref:Proliferation-associated protein 2G4-like n=1 Tax=Rhizophora mucronata TaxID=61149 RepID=A0A2P2LUW8_RHIMU
MPLKMLLISIFKPKRDLAIKRQVVYYIAITLDTVSDKHRQNLVFLPTHTQRGERRKSEKGLTIHDLSSGFVFGDNFMRSEIQLLLLPFVVRHHFAVPTTPPLLLNQ